LFLALSRSKKKKILYFKTGKSISDNEELKVNSTNDELDQYSNSISDKKSNRNKYI